MKEIQLVNNRGTLQVSDEDYEWALRYKWYLCSYKNRVVKYARTVMVKKSQNSGKQITKYIHQLLSVRIYGHECLLDHKNYDGLNNTRENLRKANYAQNLVHREKVYIRSGRKVTSKYKGVSYSEKYGKWRARITVDSKSFTIYTGNSEVKAAIAYNLEVSKLHGEFAVLNDIPDDTPTVWLSRKRGERTDRMQNKSKTIAG